MRFEDVIKKEQILYIEEKVSYEDLLNTAVEKLKNLYNIQYEKERIIKELKDRDKLGNTAFKEGFAIPHARLDNIDGVHILVIKVKHAVTIPQPSGDKEVNLLVFFIVSQSSPNLYLKILSSMIKFFSINKRENLQKLIACNNSEDIHNLFLNSELEIKHKIKVADIMNYYTVVVNPEDNVKEVMNRLYKHQTNTAFVVDNDNKPLGYISIAHLLKLVIPDYMEFLGDLSFVKEFEPFEKLLREESKVTAKEVMADIEMSLELDSSILEAAYYITKNPKTNIPVLENGILKGTITPKAFLNKILRS